MKQIGREKNNREPDFISKKSLEEKMIPLIAELFKEDAVVPIAKSLLQALADEPEVINSNTSHSGNTQESEKGEQS